MNGKHRWLEVEAGPGTCGACRCIALADLHCDGDCKLIIADVGGPQSQLKVLKGVSVIGETTLPELPSGLVAVVNEVRTPRCPLLAVSSASSIYLYRNLKPYYKFTLPLLEVNALEADLWLQARDAGMDPKRLYDMISGLQQEIGFSNLSQQSQRLLSADSNADELRSQIAAAAPHPLTRKTVITCMTTLQKNSNDWDAISCLVVGSEDGAVTLVDSEAFTVIEKVEQRGDHGAMAIPALIQTSGMLDVEFRIIISNRDGKFTLLRRGWKQTKLFAQVSMLPVDMALLPNSQLIIVTTSLMECYSKKGRRLWGQSLPGSAIGLTKLSLEHLGLTLVAVAFKGGEVHLYDGRQLVDVLNAPESVTAMVFGRFGQEDHCLIFVTVGGTILVKLLKRTAQFTAADGPATSPLLAKLPIPKRTRLIAEQVARERENAVDIHHGFQRGLFQLRLQAARDLAQTIQKSSSLISTDSKLPIKMTAQVFGLGPTFKIRITLDNMAATLDYSLPSMRICLYYNHQLYTVTPPTIQVPYLVPGLVYQLEAMVSAVGEVLVSEEVMVLLVTASSSKPVLSTAVHIPVCDLLPIEI